LRATPQGEATRIGEALSELRGRLAGRDVGGVVLISDGIDTGRIARGRLMARPGGLWKHWMRRCTRFCRRALAARSVGGSGADRRLRLCAHAHQAGGGPAPPGYGNRQVEVTLAREGRLLDAKAVLLRGESGQEKVSFDYSPVEPGNFVFEIKTPVLAGEALESNNSQMSP